MDGELAENAAWTYETPYPAMELIRDRVAFFPHPVEVYEPDEPDRGRSIDEAVLHTDAGDGASQREHWPPSVEDPR
jgi:hypothetical protein